MILVLLCTLHPNIFAQLSKKEADVLIQTYMNAHELDDETWLYSKSAAMSNATIPLIFGESITTPVPNSYVYFLDEIPYAGWTHACRFLFVQVDNGDIISISSKIPPISLEGWTQHFAINEAISPIKLFPFSGSNRNTSIAQNCFAVIISGGINKDNNYERYWNDCAAMYSTLANLYGYKDENIYVIMSDGTNSGLDRKKNSGGYDSSPLDLDGDGDNDIMYAATKANITTVFNELSEKLTQNDHLFIFTTDHGGQNLDGSVSMCLWGENISATEFANKVDKVDAKTINIVMEQCHSGGFIPVLSKKGRSIATACAANESSFCTRNYAYNEFVYHWISAVAGCTPDGKYVDADNNNDGYVSMKEAFNYAEVKDTQDETPQYISVKSHYGEFLTLLGDNLCSTVYASNKTYNTNTELYGCDVTVNNVSVSNNAKLIIETMGNATLNSNTSVELGASLEIK